MQSLTYSFGLLFSKAISTIMNAAKTFTVKSKRKLILGNSIINEKRLPITEETISLADKSGEWVNLAVALIRKKVIEDIGLYNEIKKLPQKYRVVIHLFYYEGLTVKEIAHITNRKEAPITSQLTRGRTLLKKTLKEEYDFA